MPLSKICKSLKDKVFERCLKGRPFSAFSILMIRVRKNRYFGLVVSFCLLFLGCWNPFAPKLINSLESSDLILAPQESPQEVLQNFRVAYTFRDSLLYSDLLDTAFLFVYFDPNEGTSGRFVSWERETDLRTTGRLFRHFQIVELVWKTTFYEWKDQEKGEISKGFDLTLISEENEYRLSGRVIFSFRKCADAKWRITRWKDESDI